MQVPDLAIRALWWHASSFSLSHIEAVPIKEWYRIYILPFLGSFRKEAYGYQIVTYGSPRTAKNASKCGFTILSLSIDEFLDMNP